MNEIKVGEEVYAIKASADYKTECEWYGDKHESLQAQKFSCDKGREFRPHYHLLNPRTIKRTQEAFIVISGKIRVDIYDLDKVIIGSLEAGAGEAVFVYRGGHGVKVLEDCVAYEIKAGQFTYFSEDKEFIG